MLCAAVSYKNLMGSCSISSFGSGNSCIGSHNCGRGLLANVAYRQGGDFAHSVVVGQETRQSNEVEQVNLIQINIFSCRKTPKMRTRTTFSL